MTVNVLLIFSALPTVVLAQSATAPTNYQSFGPAYGGDDIESIDASIGPKTEFETTDAYEARKNAAKKDGTRMTFVIASDDRARNLFTFDADAEMMILALKVDSKTFYSSISYSDILNTPKYNTLSMRYVIRSQKEQIASNAYGATAKIKSFVADEYGLILDQKLPPIILLPMSTIEAKTVKPYLRAAIVCTHLGKSIMKEVQGQAATFQNPIEYYVESKFLPIVINEILVFDHRTGIVLLQVRSGDASDDLAQRERRRKLYPIELEVSGGGLLYATVDDGDALFVSSNEILRGKKRITLKLKSEFSIPTFVLNGAPFQPAWRVYQTSLGYTKMFDRAEAEIAAPVQ